MLSDGYTEVPPGKTASLLSSRWWRRRHRGPRPAASAAASSASGSPSLTGIGTCSAASAKTGCGSHACIDTALRQIIHDRAVEVYALTDAGAEAALLELDFRIEGDCEIAFFGLTPSLLGRGAGRWLMNRALENAWSWPIRRVWTHTCTLDHPGALAFYLRTGFTPYRRQIEIADDPRVVGTLPRTAAPQVPLI